MAEHEADNVGHTTDRPPISPGKCTENIHYSALLPFRRLGTSAATSQVDLL